MATLKSTPDGWTEDEPEQEPIDLAKAFQEAHKTGKWTLPFAWHCQVCEKEVRNIRTVPFCRTHKAEHSARRRRLVSTSELSHQWDDTLAHWADRPAELDDEPNANEFRFHWPEGGWLLFSRGFPSRLPDWLAIHSETGEVRRFVAVSSTEVVEELLGGNAAPDQEDLETRWGDPGPTLDPLAMMRAFHDPSGRIDLAAIFDKCDFPVYGLVSEFMELELDGHCYGGGRRPGEIGSVELGFKRPGEPGDAPAVWIDSRKRRYRAIHQEPEFKKHEIEGFAETVIFLYWP